MQSQAANEVATLIKVARLKVDTHQTEMLNLLNGLWRNRWKERHGRAPDGNARRMVVAGREYLEPPRLFQLKDIPAAHSELVKRLHETVAGTPTVVDLPPRCVISVISGGVNGPIFVKELLGRPHERINGAFLSTLLDHADKIRRCARHRCGGFFFAHRSDKVFCSPHCRKMNPREVQDAG